MSGKTSEIKKLVNKVSKSELLCEEKTNFLSFLLSKVQAFVAVSKADSESYEELIIVLKEEIVEATL